jgi:hypothetical protein
MKILIPVILEVKSSRAADLGLSEPESLALREAIRTTLGFGQAQGFNHAGAERMSARLASVGEVVPFDTEGPNKVNHEFDHEPTYIGPETEGATVVLEPDIPVKLRLQLAPLLAGILNGVKTPESDAISVLEGDLLCELEWIGEGRSGDFDEEDPKDERLLRFTILRKEDGIFEPLPNGSFCTNLTLPRSEEDMKLAAKVMLRLIQKEKKSVKSLCEELSHADWQWLEQCTALSKDITPRESIESRR